jgi:D-proline reductase (dithiol) PrdB
VATIDDTELAERLFLKSYPFRRYAPRTGDPVSSALTPLRKLLAECTVALVTTAGLSLSSQTPFDVITRMGDTSFREIPGDISPQVLEMNQRSWAFDKTGVLRDRNLAFPLDRLHEMQIRGEIGAVAKHHDSFMGSIVEPAKLIRASAPEVARQLASENVDVVTVSTNYKNKVYSG